MSMIGTILNLAPGMGRPGKGWQSATQWIIRAIQASIREEILFLLFRATAGLALAVMMSFSLIIVGQTVFNELLTLENGPAWVIVVFLSVAALCGGGLFLLFFKGQREREPSGEAQLLPINVRRIAIAFIDGMMEGASSTPKARVTDSVSSWP